MRRLILLRHAKSDWPDEVEDHERPLGPRGLRDAPRMGEALAARGFVPDHALVSSARRTRETYDLVAPSFPPLGVTIEPTIYEADARMILAAIRKAPASARTLLVVGHNPGLETLAPALLRDGDREPFLRGHEKFPTGAALVMALPSEDWASMPLGTGTVELFLVPRELE